MRTYDIDNKNKESIYEYLYNCIKTDIIRGVLKSGEKLPSKRAFASNQGVSVVTVENTYGQLLAEGYIYSVPKSGFFVSDIENLLSETENKTSSDENNGNTESYVYALSDKKPDDKENIIFNLSTNHTPSENFPFSIWAKIMRRLLTEQDEALMKSPSTGGVFELRKAIAKHLKEFRGISVNPSQIIIGAGTEYLYGLIVQLLGRDKVYGLEDPCSNKIRNIYKALDVKTSMINLDEDGILIDKCDSDVIQISPSHQFPLGVVTSISRRFNILQWANTKEGRYIIEDDYDSEFRLQGRPIPSLFSIDNTGKVIYFNTFTKSLSSTIRISYMVLPEHLLKTFNERLGFYSCTVSNFEQYTLASFISEGYFEKHINRMRNRYRELRNNLIKCMYDSSLGDKILISEEDSGIHFLMKINTRYTDEQLKIKALDNGVLLSFVSDYLSDENIDKQLIDKYKNIAIINYTGLKSSDVKALSDTLNRAWR